MMGFKYSTRAIREPISLIRCGRWQRQGDRRKSKGSSMYNIHRILRSLDPLPPLCPQNLHCLFLQICCFLDPPPLLCGRHIWKPTKAKERHSERDDDFAELRGTKSDETEQSRSPWNSCAGIHTKGNLTCHSRPFSSSPFFGD